MNATAERSAQISGIRTPQSPTEGDRDRPYRQTLSMSPTDEPLWEDHFLATTDVANQHYLGKIQSQEAFTVPIDPPVALWESTKASLISEAPLWNAYVNRYQVVQDWTAHGVHAVTSILPLIEGADLQPLWKTRFAFSELRDPIPADFILTTMSGARAMVEVKQYLWARTGIREVYLQLLTQGLTAWEQPASSRIDLQTEKWPALTEAITQQARELLHVVKAQASLLGIPIESARLCSDDHELGEEEEWGESAVMIVNCRAPLDRVLTLWRMTNAERDLQKTWNINLDLNWQG